MYQNVVILGPRGNVGRSLIDQMYEKRDMDPAVHAHPTRIVGLAGSKDCHFNLTGLSREQVYNFIANKDGHSTYTKPADLISIAGKSLDNLIFIDVTAANEPMIEFHCQVIQETPYSIVTANKNPIARVPYETFKMLTKNPDRYGYRCSVMAGADAVTFIRDIIDLRDVIRSIEGCFSGTLGYIATQLQTGKPFSTIVKEAKKEGYTEPDPRDDLNGIDVARKLTVLARTAGYAVNLENIQINPFIPEKFFRNESIDSFMDSLHSLDEDFSLAVAQAKQENEVLRYVAKTTKINGTPEFRVSLEPVGLDNPLSSLKDTENMIIITSDTHNNPSYKIGSAGAGLRLTAQNARREIADRCRDRHI